MEEQRGRFEPVYRASSEAEAEIARGRLESEGLDVFLRPDPAAGGILVLVPAVQAAAARAAFAEAQPDKAESRPDLQVLHKAASEEEAQAVRAHLAREGIPSTLGREETAFGEQIVVMVPRELSFEAGEALSRFPLGSMGG